jgi:hypothetical protein
MNAHVCPYTDDTVLYQTSVYVHIASEHTHSTRKESVNKVIITYLIITMNDKYEYAHLKGALATM